MAARLPQATFALAQRRQMVEEVEEVLLGHTSAMQSNGERRTPPPSAAGSVQRGWPAAHFLSSPS